MGNRQIKNIANSIDKKSEVKKVKLPDDKRVKQARITLAVFFILIECINLLPFMIVVSKEKEQALSLTIIDMIFKPIISGEVLAGIVASLFFFLPLVGLIACLVDKTSRKKAVIGLISSFAGIVAVLMIVTPLCISIGSFFAMILYVITFMISAILFLFKTSQYNETRVKAEERENAKPHIKVKINKDGKAELDK